jgi:hypothetical protein
VALRRRHRAAKLLDVNNLAVAEFVAPAFNIVTRTEERVVRRVYMRMSIRNRDEADMATFHAAHPQHVKAELEFYAQRNELRRPPLVHLHPWRHLPLSYSTIALTNKILIESTR